MCQPAYEPHDANRRPLSLIMSFYTFRLTRRNRAASAARWMKLALRFFGDEKK
jgi:hypothetical protein